MSDDALREILSSPIGEGGRRSKRAAGPQQAPPPRRDGPWLVGAMIVGALIVLVAYTLAGADDAPDADPTTPPAATDTTVPTGDPPVTGTPAGYHPLDDRFAARVERVLIRPDGTFVSLSVVLTPTIDGESLIFPGGSWDLVLTDGTRISSIDQVTDPEARGFVTVRFDPGDYQPADLAAIEHTGVAQSTQEGIESGGDSDPFVIPESGEVAVPHATPEHLVLGNTGVVVDDIVLTGEGARMAWRVIGDEEILAIVGGNLELVTSTDQVVRLHGRSNQDPGFVWFFGGGHTLPRTLRTEGELAFVAEGVTEIPTGELLTLRFHGALTWVMYTPTSARVPIGDAPITVVD